MLERCNRTIIFTTDDVNSPINSVPVREKVGLIAQAWENGVTISPSVDMTFRVTKEIATTLSGLEPGIHLNLFNDKLLHLYNHLLGNPRVLSEMLTYMESNYATLSEEERSGRHNLIKMAFNLSNMYDYVRAEINRQLQLFQDVFKQKPHHMTLHNGAHFILPLYKTYEQIAIAQGVPYRWAGQYLDPTYGETLKPNSTAHPDYMFDALNTEAGMAIPEITTQTVLDLIAPLENGQRGEVMLHIGELNKGNQTVFISPKIVQELDKYGIKTGSWDELIY